MNSKTTKATSSFRVLMLAAMMISTLVLFYLMQTEPAPVYAGDPGFEMVRKYNCTFCHITEVASVTTVDDPDRNCAYCHYERQNVRYLAPDFNRIATRLRPEWIKSYLAKPYHVRPHLKEEMPDFEFIEEEIDVLLDYLQRHSKPVQLIVSDTQYLKRQSESHDDWIEKGFFIGERYMCFGCHDFTGVTEPIRGSINTGPKLTNFAYFAPDLIHTRDRMKPELIQSYILDPQTYDPMGFMPPAYGLTEEEAGLLTYFILFAEEDPAMIFEAVVSKREPVEIPEFIEDILPILNRYCVSCHYDHKSKMMGWATGFKGGFGYPARHFAVTSYEAMMAGSRTDDGGAYEVIIPGYEHSILLMRMRGRQKPKMPFGQKMDEVDIQTFENWVMNGAPGPPEGVSFELVLPGDDD